MNFDGSNVIAQLSDQMPPAIGVVKHGEILLWVKKESTVSLDVKQQKKVKKNSEWRDHSKKGSR